MITIGRLRLGWVRLLVEAGVLLLLLCVSLIAARAAWPLPPSRGLLGRYWTNAEFRGEPAREAFGTTLTIDSIRQALDVDRTPAFSAEWTGGLFAEVDGPYRFDLTSDDGAWLFIDEELGKGPVVDNGGIHAMQTETAVVNLSRGTHRIRLRYVQAGGDSGLTLTWTPPGGTPVPLPPEVLSPDAGSAVDPAERRHRLRAATVITCLWAALLFYLPVRLMSGWLARRITETRPDRLAMTGLAGVGLLAIVVCAWGLPWGLRGGISWASDELPPFKIQEGIGAAFSGGWSALYGPLHYYTLAIPLTAFRIAESIGLLPAGLASWQAQLGVMRAVSVLMGLGALALTYLIAAEMLGARRAVLAPFVLLCTPTFAYYGKTANVDMPYVFWLAIALWAYVGIVKRGGMHEHVLFGVAAAAAVGTKDQAYGFFALLPIALVALEVRRRRQSGLGRYLSAVWDPKLVAGGLAALATFALIHNPVANFSGFSHHMVLVRNAAAYRMFEFSPSGYAELARLTLVALRFSLGWPWLVLTLAGLGMAIATPSRRWWLWLMAPVGSYCIAFLGVALYTYDRFLLGVQIVLAVFAAAAAADLVTLRRWRAGWVVLVAACMGYSLLNALSVGVMMSRDSRQAAGAWIDGCLPGRASMAVLGRPDNMPRFSRHRPTWMWEESVDFGSASFDYVTVNEKFFERMTARSRRLPQGVRLRPEEAGYKEVARFRPELPAWAVFAREAVFSMRGEAGWTNLDKVSPPIVVYARPNAPAPTCAVPPGGRPRPESD